MIGGLSATYVYIRREGGTLSMRSRAIGCAFSYIFCGFLFHSYIVADYRRKKQEIMIRKYLNHTAPRI